MKLSRYFFVIAMVLLSAVSVWASPEERVAAMIKDLNRTGSYTALLDYIHWQSSFASMSPHERQRMGISSPAQLRSQVQGFMEQPERVFQQQFNEKLKSMSPDQRRVMESHYQQQLVKMRQTLEEMKGKLRRTSYKILGSTVSGDRATVTVEGVVDGRTKLRDIQLTQIQGEWFLPSVGGQIPQFD